MTPTSTTKDKTNKRASVFGSLFGKKDSATSPAEKTKEEGTVVSETAPQLDPVPTTTDTAAPTAAPATTETKPVTEAAAATTTATSPSDKRRTSFFSNLGTKKEKKADGTSGDELTDSEKKKEGGIGGLLRKASRAAPKKNKETKSTAAEVPLPKETTTETSALTNGETAAADTAKTTPAAAAATPAAPIAVAQDAPVAVVAKPEETAAANVTA